MVTIKDIAAEAGVSDKTVSRILKGENKEIWPSSIRRANQIREIAKRMSFRPNAMARALRTNKTHMIGVLIRNASDLPDVAPSNYEIILGFYHYLENTDYEICLVHQSDISCRSRIFTEKMLDGLIVLGHFEKDMIEEIRGIYPHCVWANTNVDEPVGCVRRNELEAGRLVGEAILSCGYQQVVWIGNSRENHDYHYSRMDRITGLCQGMGAELESSMQVIPHSEQLPDILDRLLGHIQPQTAIVPYDILNAQILLNVLAKKQMLPGRDVGVVCPDDSDMLHRIALNLSRVSHDRNQMGKDAVQLLCNQLSGRKHDSIMFSGEWIEGGTLIQQNNIKSISVNSKRKK